MTRRVMPLHFSERVGALDPGPQDPQALCPSTTNQLHADSLKLTGEIAQIERDCDEARRLLG